jgi:hypothetical protein
MQWTKKEKEKKRKNLCRWHRWYAWYPVKLGEGEFTYSRKDRVWLEFVERKRNIKGSDYQNTFGGTVRLMCSVWWDYRVIQNGED